LSVGLPVVQAYRDTDLSPGLDCVLQIENTEDNVERYADEIAAFTRASHGSQKLGEAALALARGPLSAAHKERQRLELFEQVCGRSG
jgi:hypothetical protein